MLEPEEHTLQLRRKARRTALEILYEVDCAAHAPGTVLQRRLDEGNFGDPTAAFLSDVVSGVLENRDALDELIQRYAPEWPVEQMAIIDRNILRIAIWELVVSRKTPLKVAINEAVELAKVYGSDSAPRFVNGVLGTLAIKQQELIAAFQED
jgi:N utilization substance protein B